jgi:hypothetical protein
MSKRIVFLFLLGTISLLAIQCSKSVGRQVHDAAIKSPTFDVDTEEQGVYSTILNDVYVGEKNDRLTIADDTSLDWLTTQQIMKDLSFLKGGAWHEIKPSIVDDFLSRNSVPSKLTGRLNLKVNALMLSKEEVATIGKSQENWKQFLARNPGQSIITLSRVGFTDDLKNALVYTGDQSGGRSGRGQYVFLSRTDRWIIKHKVLAWGS